MTRSRDGGGGSAVPRKAKSKACPIATVLAAAEGGAPQSQRQLTIDSNHCSHRSVIGAVDAPVAVPDTGPIPTIEPARASGGRDGSWSPIRIERRAADTACATAGRDRTEAEKRGFTTMREAELYPRHGNGAAKAKGEYIDTVASRVPVPDVCGSNILSKQPPMSKPSYYMTPGGHGKDHVAPVWADREISSIRRSEVQDWVSDLTGAEVAHGHPALTGDVLHQR